MAPEEIVEPADPVPPVAISFKNDPMFAVGFGTAVFADDKIDETFAALDSNIQSDTLWFFIKIVQGHDGIRTPVIAHAENIRVAG